MAEPGGGERARSYDAVAAAYDRGRPGYPDELVSVALAVTRTPAGGRILEIGCGSGQATRPFAERGFRMTCLEPGRNLAALAGRNLAAYPGVEILNVRFEDWDGPPGAWDLVLAATSLHHVAAGIRYVKAARALKPGGWLAVLGNHPGEDDPPFRAALDRAYARWRGEDANATFAASTPDTRLAAARAEIEASALFDRIEAVRRSWRVEYDAAAYRNYLESDSQRLNVTREAHEGLKRDVTEAIGRLGGRAARGFVATAVLARAGGRS